MRPLPEFPASENFSFFFFPFPFSFFLFFVDAAFLELVSKSCASPHLNHRLFKILFW